MVEHARAGGQTIAGASMSADEGRRRPQDRRQRWHKSSSPNLICIDDLTSCIVGSSVLSPLA